MSIGKVSTRVDYLFTLKCVHKLTMQNESLISINETAIEKTGYSSSSKSAEVITWIVLDVVIIVLIVAGNILTICAIKLNRKISELLSNRYVFSLAVSDLMVGLTIPYHLAFTIGDGLDSYKTTCVLRFVLIILACSSSIYNLLAIAADRYIAIVLPFHYSRHMSRRFVWTIVFGGWCLSIAIATMPIYWNYWSENSECKMDTVLPADYINFIIAPMFGSIWLAMSLLYLRIWKEAADHAKRLRSTTTHLHSQKYKKTLKENKSVQMVLLILGCFSICWLPYFIIIIGMRFIAIFRSSLLYECAFTMAVANSCMNPLIYAWKSQNYRQAFLCMLKCKSPSTLNQEPNYITDHVPKKRNSTMEIMDGCKTIELHCGRNSSRYDERENSDVTITTCLDACSIGKLTRVN